MAREALTIVPPGRPLVGRAAPPGSKSITNRALLLAGLAKGTSRLTGALKSDDTRYMADALRAMGVTVAEPDATTFVVESAGRLAEPAGPLFLGNAGTATRFLTAAAALVNGTVVVDGDEHMRKRPIAPLVDAMRALGIEVAAPTGCPPVTVKGTGGFDAEKILIDGGLSSQYVSALLMMAAGSVLRATGETRLTALGGLARAMPLTAVAMVLGGLSLAALPLTAGFVSKSAIMAALAEDQARFYWFALTAVSAGSFLYIGLKLPWFALFGAQRATVAVEPTRSMKAAMGLLCVLILGLGCFPGLLIDLAPEIAGVSILTPDHILFQLQMLIAASCIFVWALPLLRPRAASTLDVDWLWRELPGRLAPHWRRLMQLLSQAGAGLLAAAQPDWSMFSAGSIRRLSAAGNWRTGQIAFWATALLGIYVLIAAL